MFDLVQKHKRVAQVILFLLMVPFAFFGVDYYFRGGASDAAVATVGKENITQAEFAESLREQGDQMRRQMGKNFDPAMFESPEVRFALLEMLINQRLLTG
jgi:peptidyl-prolyl cis-trans isomerase D